MAMLIFYSRVSASNPEPQNAWGFQSSYYSDAFNEYVIYNDKQVAVRYVLKLTTSSNDKDPSKEQESEENSETDEDDEDEVWYEEMKPLRS